MKISVFGTGYVGLVTGTCFAEMGNDVICADIDTAKIEKLKQGFSPIYEPGLGELILSNLNAGRLSFTTDLADAVRKSDLLFIAVGTPPNEDGSADLKHVLEVADKIALTMDSYKAIITKSTVPVQTSFKVRDTIHTVLKKRMANVEFDVISNPEFLKEGSAVDDCLKPSRVIVGCESQRAKELMERLYEPFLRNGNPIIFMDILSSETTKYAANAMLATKISFMNELSRICEKVGADVERVRQGIGSDPRIGFQFIYPGIGYGGSCFPKDVKALIQTALEYGEKPSILQAVETVNREQRARYLGKIMSYFQNKISGKKIAVWGLSFKPGTDDIREAPGIDLVQALTEHGAKVQAHDPVALNIAQSYFKNHSVSNLISFFDNQYSALEGADALCIVTEWKPFREPNFEKIKKLMNTPVIFDGRNIFDPKQLRSLGFSYHAIGRP